MYLFITILILIVALVLVLLVLVQNSKGGGLASGFASSNQIMGAPKTTDFLEKATWSLTGALFVLCIIAALTIPRDIITEKSELPAMCCVHTNQLPACFAHTFPSSSLAESHR